MTEYILGRASETDPSALSLYTTCNRTFIENERPDSDRHPEALKAARKMVRTVSPSAKCRSLTAYYNCVGMAFASRRTLVDITKLSLFLRDDGYRLIRENEVYEGDIVEYRRNGISQHVGVVYLLKDVSLLHDGSSIEIWVLSQWGEDGEYLHKAREVHPIYGTELFFWSERRPES
jgi:hypothetical protein